MDVDDQQLEETLRKIGKAFFAKYHEHIGPIYAEEDRSDRTILRREIVAQILDEWIDPNTGDPITYNSCQTRISKALRIFRAGRVRDALLNIEKSKKVELR